jgi:hypothetical protein
MPEQRVVERTRKKLVRELQYPDPADFKKANKDGLRMYAQDDYKDNPELAELLAHASKCAKKALKDKIWTDAADAGRPEFLIINDKKNLAIVIECKKEKTQSLMISPSLRDNKELPINAGSISKYAADGAVHYAKFLSKTYDVIAIGVTGIDDGDDISVKTFFWKKNQILQFKEDGSACYGPFYDLKLDKLYPFSHYLNYVENESATIIKEFNEEKAAKAATELNIMLDSAGVNTMVRALLVSGLLLALRDKTFQTTYENKEIEAEALQSNLKNAIFRVIDTGDIEDDYKKQVLKDKFADTFNQQDLLTENAKKLRMVLKKLHETIYPCVNGDFSIDIIGTFYHEFLRYTKNGANNGIKLTPAIITELFCELADIKVDDTILDPCLGTGGFLIAGMNKLYSLADKMSQKEVDDYFEKLVTAGKLTAREIRTITYNNKAKTGKEGYTKKDVKDYMRKHQLVGCEADPTMFVLGCSNMILRGDGKSNILHGDCMKLQESIMAFGATVGLMNPPYSESAYNIMDFVYHLCKCVKKGKRVVVIVPTSCAHADDYLDLRNRILKENTLLGVMSMNLDLFKGIAGTITCIMVFKAGVPHKFSQKVYFGNWKEDGYIWHKTLGRVADKSHKKNRYLPKEYREKWIESFNNAGNDDEYGIWRKLTKDKDEICRDEWLWEYFVETDYTLLSKKDFEQQVKKYMLFQLHQMEVEEVAGEEIDE